MSRRTAEASKAIRDAWEKERQLVLQGLGTRDWAPEQQQSIIDFGKAYDEDGKAFEGHHMKSVQAYPEFQGESGNIQFLTRSEHLDAHWGSFQNATHGYYNPVSKSTRIFGDDGYEPCEIINLSTPIISRDNNCDETYISEKPPEEDNSGDIEPVLKETVDYYETLKENTFDNDEPVLENQPRGIKGFFSRLSDTWGEFSTNHPVIAGAIKFGLSLAGTAALGELTNRHSQSENGSDYASRDTDYESNNSSSYGNSDPFISGPTEYPEIRNSPREHDVSGYTRKQNGKDVKVRPHKRGGK